MTLIRVQILKPMLHPAVAQFAQRTILIAALHHAQNSIKVAARLDPRLLIDRRGVDRNDSAEHQRHQRDPHREIAAGPLRQRAAAHPAQKAQDARARQPDRILAEFAENARRDRSRRTLRPALRPRRWSNRTPSDAAATDASAPALPGTPCRSRTARPSTPQIVSTAEVATLRRDHHASHRREHSRPAPRKRRAGTSGRFQKSE